MKPRFLGILVLIVGAACSSDIFDIDVNLQSHAFTADFGAPVAGTIPTVPCDVGGVATCNPGGQVIDVASAPGDVPAEASVSIACDASTQRCYAQASTHIAYSLNVLTDDDFITKVERKGISFVRVVDLAYTVPVNTLTFDVPSVDVYAGPEGAQTPTDPGVVLIDSTPPIAAGETFVSEPRHLTLADDSAARTLIQDSIRAKQTFVLIVAATPRLEAGAPIPSGQLEIDIYPKIQLGLP